MPYSHECRFFFLEGHDSPWTRGLMESAEVVRVGWNLLASKANFASNKLRLSFL
jgi:hypothetical protein